VQSVCLLEAAIEMERTWRIRHDHALRMRRLLAAWGLTLLLIIATKTLRHALLDRQPGLVVTALTVPIPRSVRNPLSYANRRRHHHHSWPYGTTLVVARQSRSETSAVPDNTIRVSLADGESQLQALLDALNRTNDDPLATATNDDWDVVQSAVAIWNATIGRDKENNNDAKSEVSPLAAQEQLYRLVWQVHWLTLRRCRGGGGGGGRVRASPLLRHQVVESALGLVSTTILTLETWALCMEILLWGQRPDLVAEWHSSKRPSFSATGAEEDNVEWNRRIQNTVIQAMALQGDLSSAMDLLHETLSLHSNNDLSRGDSCIDWTTWVRVLQVHARRGLVVELEESLVPLLERHGYHANATRVQNALLQALVASAAASTTSSSPSSTLSVSKRAETILYRMIETVKAEASSLNGNAVDRSAVESNDYYDMHRTAPDQASFAYVIQSYRYNKDTAGVAFKVEQLLALQEALAQQTQSLDSSSAMVIPSPSAATLTAAIAVVARDRTDAKKAVRAQRLLERLETLGAANLYAYQRVLNACAFTPKAASAADKLAAFTIAVDCFKKAIAQQAQSEPPRQRWTRSHPSSIYGQFLAACHALLPAANPKRDALVEAAFGQCCAVGHVNDYVLDQLQRAASDALVLRLLGGFLEDGVAVPAAWSANVTVAPPNAQRPMENRYSEEEDDTLEVEEEEALVD
jgi:hypothetical protein